MDVSDTVIGHAGGQQWKEQMLHGKLETKEQIDEVAKQFEGILIRQFLDKALTPMDKENGGLFGMKSSPMYEHLVKDTLADSITKHSSLGFSSVLQAQLYSESDTQTLNTK